MTSTAPVDLSDFALWRNGFPDELFTELRRERPIFHHALKSSGERTASAIGQLAEMTAAASKAAARNGSPLRVRHSSQAKCAASTALPRAAGPTHEDVDPVRYLGNRSSGRMGFAIAAEAARRGAEVTLVDVAPKEYRQQIAAARAAIKSLHN